MATDISYPKDFNKYIDTDIFESLFTLDEDEGEGEGERRFSKQVIFDFFEQAEESLLKLDEALKAKDIRGLSDLAHYLRGQAATIGAFEVKNRCQKILDECHAENPEYSRDEALQNIGKEMEKLRKEFKLAEGVLKEFRNKTD